MWAPLSKALVKIANTLERSEIFDAAIVIMRIPKHAHLAPKLQGRGWLRNHFGRWEGQIDRSPNQNAEYKYTILEPHEAVAEVSKIGNL